MRVVRLVFTGGTISMQRDAGAGGNVPRHGGQDLVAMMPGLADVTPFEVEDWGRFPSSHLTQAQLWALRERIRTLAEAPPAGLAGVVITHGTDSLEETAYLLARTLEPQVPVVLTGAMRTSSDDEWDGPRNLRDAALVASRGGEQGLREVMVAFNGQIFSGLDAVKLHASDLGAFGAPHSAPLGVVEGDRLRRWAQPDRVRALRPPGLTARVALVPVIVEDRGELIEAALAAGFDGLVVAGYGQGNIPPGAVPALRRWLDAGKPVVLATRCFFGAVAPGYAFDGGGAKVLGMGAIEAGPRTPAQARMELAIALSAGGEYGG